MFRILRFAVLGLVCAIPLTLPQVTEAAQPSAAVAKFRTGRWERHWHRRDHCGYYHVHTWHSGHYYGHGVHRGHR